MGFWTLENHCTRLGFGQVPRANRRPHRCHTFTQQDDVRFGSRFPEHGVTKQRCINKEVQNNGHEGSHKSFHDLTGNNTVPGIIHVWHRRSKSCLILRKAKRRPTHSTLQRGSSVSALFVHRPARAVLHPGPSTPDHAVPSAEPSPHPGSDGLSFPFLLHATRAHPQTQGTPFRTTQT